MEKHFTYLAESLMLFVFILAISFVSSFFFDCLPSWLIIISSSLFLAAMGDVYNLFEKLRLFVPIAISSVFLLIFTVLSFIVFDLPSSLKFLLCLQTAFAMFFVFYIRKELKHTYSGNFPIAYKRNCDIVYNSCAAFIMAFDGKYTDRILSSFIDFTEYDFEPFPEFSSRSPDLNHLMLRTLDHVLFQLASEPRFYNSRGDNDDWHKSNDTLIGSLLEIYQKVQSHYEKDFIEACRKWGVLVALVNRNHSENPPPVLTPEEDFQRRLAEAHARIFPSKGKTK